MVNRSFRHALTAIGVGGLALALCAAPAGASPTKHHPSGPVVVVTGLNNPRQLSLVDGVELLVAEAGKGGPNGPIDGPEGPTFFGTTGSVSAVWFPQFAHNQSPRRIVTGLISAAGADGSGATGADGVSSRHLGDPVYVQITTAPPGLLPPKLDAQQNGKLVRLKHGGVNPIADLGAFEAKHNPDGHEVESNPYSVLALRNGELVADAAGNDVLFVDKRGHIRVFHVFPNVTTGACAGQADPSPEFPGCNFVPTSLATDRWGNVYVGGLSSLTPGEAKVVKLDPSGKHVLHTWDGFTSVTGLAVGRDGSLYVSQLFAPESTPGGQGVVTKISHNGHRTNVDVPLPAGLALDGFGNVYVSAFSIAPSTGLGIPGIDSSGQVWRLRI
jgi:hypothetical protein